MSEATETAETQKKDIVFECPSCGKSMVINERGAGMTIPCPDCSELVQVPNIDPREDVVVSQAKQIRELSIKLKDVTARRRYLERLRSEHLAQMSVMKREFGVIQESLDRIANMLAETER